MPAGAYASLSSAPSISGQKGNAVRTELIPTRPTKPAPRMEFPTTLIESVLVETPVPLGWMRSVYALQAAFALGEFHR